MAAPLTNIINLFQAIFPDAWKIANAPPLLKGGHNKLSSVKFLV
jgi:hypothetical protein